MTKCIVLFIVTLFHFFSEDRGQCYFPLMEWGSQQNNLRS